MRQPDSSDEQPTPSQEQPAYSTPTPPSIPSLSDPAHQLSEEQPPLQPPSSLVPSPSEYIPFPSIFTDTSPPGPPYRPIVSSLTPSGQSISPSISSYSPASRPPVGSSLAYPPRSRKRLPTFTILLIILATLLTIISSIGAFLILNSNSALDTRRTATATSLASENATVQVISTAITAQQGTITVMGANPYGGSLILDDPLHDNSLGHQWNTEQGCSFVGHPGSYIATEAHTFESITCAPDNLYLRDFAIQVQMTILMGSYGGIQLRGSLYASYVFFISRNGQYEFDYYPDRSAGHEKRLTFGQLPDSAQLTRPNLIAVVARGNKIDLYWNQEHLTTIRDGSLTHGYFGFIAGTSDNEPEAVVAYNNAKVWEL